MCVSVGCDGGLTVEDSIECMCVFCVGILLYDVAFVEGMCVFSVVILDFV